MLSLVPFHYARQRRDIMKRQACLLCETVQYSANDQILVLNSAADPFVRQAVERFSTSTGNGCITLAEDNVALANALLPSPPSNIIHHVAFHDYIAHAGVEKMDVAVMNLLYQPNNSWMYYGLQAAAHALKEGGLLYVTGAKERGILSMARHIEELFGNVETLLISKGQRVLLARARARARARKKTVMEVGAAETQVLRVFASNKLDEGTRLLLDALDVQATDEALDIGCGAGLIGLHMARLANKGNVTMVDVSLAAVDATQQAIRESTLTNVRVLSSDGAQAVLKQRFDLVATNPPFHQGGIQTTALADRFIREAAQVLRPQGRFYLVANRFLKYEYSLQACFQSVAEVGGDTRYKVLRAVKSL
jgi:16S rRNA (guanine1207-N2)-methyltransferase